MIRYWITVLNSQMIQIFPTKYKNNNFYSIKFRSIVDGFFFFFTVFGM